MKIALIGHGGMGKAVEKIALERGHEIVAIIEAGDAVDFAGADIAIDFSLAESVFENTKAAAEAGIPLILGSTGWYENIDEVSELAKNIPCLWSSNFSIGVNLYFKIIEEASKLVNKFDEYDIWGHEIHHHNKADSPSGTAKTLSEILLKNIDRKDKIFEEKLDRKREDNEIHFSSVRGGPVNFAHTIAFDSAADKVLISHEARNRDGYALGALKAAEWLAQKDVGFYTMNDFLNL